jgi:hypothetical protein
MADARGIDGWRPYVEEWLASTASEHTRDAYGRAAADWLAYLAEAGAEPGRATASAARAWQRRLRARGLSETSVNCRLAAVSSLYRFVMREAPALAPEENPLRQVRRGRVVPYGRANVLPDADLRRLWAHLAAHNATASGARNEALLLTYFLTGARAAKWCGCAGGRAPHRSRPGERVWMGSGRAARRRRCRCSAAWEGADAYRRWPGGRGGWGVAAEARHGTANPAGRCRRLPRNRPHISRALRGASSWQSLRAAGWSGRVVPAARICAIRFAHHVLRQTQDWTGCGGCCITAIYRRTDI